MADIIDFALERAKRKSGLNCSVTLKDMLKEGYDPCDPLDIQAYNDWQAVQGIIHKEMGPEWSDEALERLFKDIENFDEDNKTFTIEYNSDGDPKELLDEILKKD